MEEEPDVYMKTNSPQSCGGADEELEMEEASAEEEEEEAMSPAENQQQLQVPTSPGTILLCYIYIA